MVCPPWNRWHPRHPQAPPHALTCFPRTPTARGAPQLPRGTARGAGGARGHHPKWGRRRSKAHSVLRKSRLRIPSAPPCSPRRDDRFSYIHHGIPLSIGKGMPNQRVRTPQNGEYNTMHVADQGDDQRGLTRKPRSRCTVGPSSKPLA